MKKSEMKSESLWEMILIQPKLLFVIFKKKVKLMTKSESLWEMILIQPKLLFCHFLKESERGIDDKKWNEKWKFVGLGYNGCWTILGGCTGWLLFTRTTHEVWYHHNWTPKKINSFVLTALLGDNVFYQWDKMLPCATKSGHYWLLLSGTRTTGRHCCRLSICSL